MLKKTGVVRTAIALTVTALLVPAPVAAKGSFEVAVVSGPDWFGEIEITDPLTLAALDLAAFMDIDHPVAGPARLSNGYLLTRGYFSDGEAAPAFSPFDRLLVFPGSPGYAYYLEIVNGFGPLDGKWYRLTDSGQSALLGALQSAGVRLSTPQIQDSNSTLSVDPPRWLMPALAALVGVAAGWIAGRAAPQRRATDPG